MKVDIAENVKLIYEINSVLDDSKLDFSEELLHVTNCGTPVDKNHKAKDQLSVLYMYCLPCI